MNPVGLFPPLAPPGRLDLRPVGKKRASGAEKAGFNVREGINAKAFSRQGAQRHDEREVRREVIDRFLVGVISSQPSRSARAT